MRSAIVFLVLTFPLTSQKAIVSEHSPPPLSSVRWSSSQYHSPQYVDMNIWYSQRDRQTLLVLKASGQKVVTNHGCVKLCFRLDFPFCSLRYLRVTMKHMSSCLRRITSLLPRWEMPCFSCGVASYRLTQRFGWRKFESFTFICRIEEVVLPLFRGDFFANSGCGLLMNECFSREM